MSLPLKLLVVGGYGTFGGRLVELLKDEPRLEIAVAGRSAKRWSSRAIVYGWFCDDGVYSEFHFRPGWRHVQTATKLNRTAGSGFMWRSATRGQG